MTGKSSTGDGRGPPRRRWSELTTEDFAAARSGGWVAILPIAATEQHGPHLPTGTDTMIGEGLLLEALAAMPDHLPVVVLPTLAIGKSDEHASFPGTLSLSAATLISVLVEMGEAVARAGIGKLIIISSHGGNSEVMGIAARHLRLHHGMLAVATSWARLGQPEGLFSETERREGIHGGDIETSLMLHIAPELVRLDRARDFVSAERAMAEEFAALRSTGPTAFSWLAEDLHPDGACGNAAAASAQKGAASARHVVAAFLSLVDDAARFDVARLERKDS